MTDCPYKIDGLQCTREFLHEGAHYAEGRGFKKTYPIEWPYDEDTRYADRDRGYVPCGVHHPHPSYAVACERPAHSEGAHEGDTEDGEHVHWTDDWMPPDPEPEAIPARVVSPQVQRTLAIREGQPVRLIALSTGQSVERYEAVNIRRHPDGSLEIETRDADVVYAAGSWRSYTSEPWVGDD